MPGGRGNRRYPRDFYEGLIRPQATRPLPDDFREQYLEHGWEAQWYYSTNWRVMARWIDQAGGEELIAARRASVKARGNRQFNAVKHVGDWTAEKLEKLAT